ncbi:MAG: FtsQ-type POTRA domain-containing protein [Chloroflexota bacterium]
MAPHSGAPPQRGPRGGKRPRTRSKSRLGEMASSVSAGDLALIPDRARPVPWSKLAAVVLLLGSLGLLYGLWTQPKYQVREVNVRGAHLVDPAMVRDLAGVLGTSIFGVRTDQVQARLIEQLGCIASATTTCRLPNRVDIEVREHRAVAVWESLGQMWWVDAQGRVLGHVRDVGDALVVHDRYGVASQPQGYIAAVPWAMLAPMLQQLPAIADLDYSREHGLVLFVTSERWPVYLGHSGDVTLKLAVMQELVDELARKRVAAQYIDLRNERRPTYRPR